MLPAFGRVNSSPASFFTETSVVATSSRVIVCPTFAITEVGVDVLPVVVGVLPETVPVVAVVPQAMSPANRMSARRMAIDLRCWLMGFLPFLFRLIPCSFGNFKRIEFVLCPDRYTARYMCRMCFVAIAPHTQRGDREMDTALFCKILDGFCWCIHVDLLLLSWHRIPLLRHRI